MNRPILAWNTIFIAMKEKNNRCKKSEMTADKSVHKKEQK